MSRQPRQWVVIVLDGVGVGALPDAPRYGDPGADTLGHLAEVAELHIPHLQNWSLGNIRPLPGVPPRPAPHVTSFGRMAELSRGKDSTAGHWELAGIITERPFPTYPNGFPADLLERFRRLTGLSWLGNKVASGTAIIRELGAEHLRTGAPIIYTSADSVFQIAAHEEIIPPEELYRICRICRAELLVGEHAVSRVIARPFTGSSGNFRRTSARRDFSLAPPRKTILNRLQEKGAETVGIGKIDDLFAGSGLTEKIHTADNAEGILRLQEVLSRPLKRDRLVMVNLVDFDMLWGHRRDVSGFKKGLEEFDAALPGLAELLAPGQVLAVTADHGNDPTAPGSDHTREYVPLLVHRRGYAGKDLGTRKSFADLAATIADFFHLENRATGTSFYHLLQERTADGAGKE